MPTCPLRPVLSCVPRPPLHQKIKKQDNDQDDTYMGLKYLIPDAPEVHIIIHLAELKQLRRLTTLDRGENGRYGAHRRRWSCFQRCAKIKEKGPRHRDGSGLKLSKSWDTWPGQCTMAAGSYVSVTPRLSSDVRKYALRVAPAANKDRFEGGPQAAYTPIRGKHFKHMEAFVWGRLRFTI